MTGTFPEFHAAVREWKGKFFYGARCDDFLTLWLPCTKSSILKIRSNVKFSATDKCPLEWDVVGKHMYISGIQEIA